MKKIINMVILVVKGKKDENLEVFLKE